MRQHLGWLISWLFRWGEHAEFAHKIGGYIAEFFGLKKTVISIGVGILAGWEVWRESHGEIQPVWIAIAALLVFVALLGGINFLLWLWDRLRGHTSRAAISVAEQPLEVSKESEGPDWTFMLLRPFRR